MAQRGKFLMHVHNLLQFIDVSGPLLVTILIHIYWKDFKNSLRKQELFMNKFIRSQRMLNN